MFKPATAAALLIALSMPAYAAGDFPMAAMQTTVPRGSSHCYRLVQAECL